MNNQLPVTMEADDLLLLKAAQKQLEHPSFAARLSNVVGTPIDIALQLLPKRWYEGLHGIAERSIAKSLDTATMSMRREHEFSAHENLYKILSAGSGAVGGLFGLAGLALELPVTTTLMMRAIAEIARDEGEHIQDPDTRAACLEVFAFGGRSELDDAAETGYYGVRMALSSYIRVNTLSAGEASGLAQLIHAVATRFGLPLTQRSAAQMMPLLGALGAAGINLIFMQHFQAMARAHFTVRRLERRYGKTLVQANYERFQRQEASVAAS